MNAEADIPVESERQVLFLSITTCPVDIFSPEQRINPIPHETTNMRALDIQKSLVIHCLCIDDIRGSLAEWAQKKESGNIIFNVQNIFASEYKSRLFKTLNNTR